MEDRLRISQLDDIVIHVEMLFQLIEILIQRVEEDPLGKQFTLREIIREDIIKIRDALQCWNKNPFEVLQKKL